MAAGTGFLIAIGATALFVPLFKLLFHRSRPLDLFYTGTDAFSFPSGHATINTVLIGIAMVLIAHDRSPLVKAGIFSVGIVYILAIAFSRIYLGAHWFSDVIGGLAFGTAMVSAFAFVFGSIHNEKIGRWWLAGIVTATLVVVGGYHIDRSFHTARWDYAPQPPVVTMSERGWLDGGWKELPARRIELNGETEEPLILQWVGDPAPLQEELAELGYERAPRWSLATLTGFLVGQTPADALPALPRTHNGRAPSIVLIREDGEEKGRWVLRLWPTIYRIADGGPQREVHVASLMHERVDYPLNELSTIRTDREEPEQGDNPLMRLPGTLVMTRANGAEVVLGGFRQ